MARIAILTCSNCTQDSNCASVVCLGDMRKRRGFFESYPKDEPLDLIGIINCAGCPTLAAPEKILKRVRAVAEFRLDALHLSFCMVTLVSLYQNLHGIDKTGVSWYKYRDGDPSTGGSRPLPAGGQRTALPDPGRAPNHERFDPRNLKDSS